MILQEQRRLLVLVLLLALVAVVAERESSSSFLRSTASRLSTMIFFPKEVEEDKKKENLIASSVRIPPHANTNTQQLNPSPRPRRELQSGEEIIVWRVANDGEPESAYPLKHCDGDCDDDDDCDDNLICFDRSAGDPVPGCRGGEIDDTTTDYCISDSEAPTNAPTNPTNPPTLPPPPTETPTAAPTVKRVEVINDNDEGQTRVSGNDFLMQMLNFSIATPPPGATHWHAPLLQKCQGICKTHTDCALGLGCYQRTIGGDVPHCEFDNPILKQSPLLLSFCTILPTPPPTPSPTPEPTLAPTSAETPEPTPNPTVSTPNPTVSPWEQYHENERARNVGYTTDGDLYRCDANCWNDWECGGDLVCWGRMGFEYLDAPGCYFDGSNPDDGGFDQWTDYNVCVDPKDIPPNTIRHNPEYDIHMARLVGTGGNLAHCEASCLSDGDCQGDMICLFRKRDNNKAAPGCYFKPDFPGGFSRGDENNYNICVYPEHLSNEELENHIDPLMFQMARFVGLYPEFDSLARCEGNCREDYECAGDLVCWGRRPGDDAPGCFFDTSAEDGIQRWEDHNICVDSNHIPEGAERYEPWSEPLPELWAYLVGNETGGNLDRCQGHCNNDWECQGSLVCWKRGEGMPAPGCYFDYGEPGGISQESAYNICVDNRGVENIHRLKLWWEEGYFWQANRDEQFWCMQQAGESVEIYECNDSPRQLWEIVYLPGEGNEVLIKSYQYQQCLRGGGPNLRECNYDGTDEAQNWIPMNGDWNSEHFELTRKGYEEFCLANHHHPRNGESIEMRGCDRERNYTTSAWTFHW